MKRPPTVEKSIFAFTGSKMAASITTIYLFLFVISPSVFAATITGMVYKAADNLPLTGKPVQIAVFTADSACRENTHVTGSGINTTDGTYTINNLAAGTYYLKTSHNNTGYVDEWWDGTFSNYNCYSAQPLVVTADGTHSNINFKLEEGGTITGTVKGVDGNPLIGVPVHVNVETTGGSACDQHWFVTSSGVNTSNGTYTIPAVPPGNHYLHIWNNNTNYTEDWWAGADTLSDPHCEKAKTVTVTARMTTQNIDFQLEEGGSISGTVYMSDGTTPITGQTEIYINAFAGGDGCNTTFAGGGRINLDGTYTISGLAAGAYYLRPGMNGPSYIEESWASPLSTPSCSQAQTVTVVSGQTATGKDFQLDQGARISGHVTGVSRGDHICLYAYTQVEGDPCNRDQQAGGSDIDENGDYSFVVPPGTYFIYFDPSCGVNTNNLLPEYWTTDNNGTIDCNQADNFLVNAGDETTKNITLDQQGAIISGTATDLNQNPIEGLTVEASTSGCNWGTSYYATTDADGNYAITVPGGAQFKVGSCQNCGNSPSGFWLDEFWDGADGTSDCNSAGIITSDIATPQTANFELAPGARISGQITGNYGDNVCINAFTLIDNTCNREQWAGGTGSDESGNYSLVVPAGTYFLQFDPDCGNNPNYLLGEYWKDGDQGTTDCAEASSFTLANAGDQTTKNIALDQPGAVISGHISGTAGGTVCVNLAVQNSGNQGICDASWPGYGRHTDANGDYSFVAPPGTYLLSTSPCGPDDPSYLVHESWTDDSNGTTDCSQADSFELSTGTNPSKNIALAMGGKVAGHVYEAGSSTPISGETFVRVDAYAGDPCADNSYIGGADVDLSDGSYITSGLPPGEVFIKVNHAEHHADSWWTATGITDDCSKASPVTVTASATTGGKDFSLPKDTDSDGVNDTDEANYGLDINKIDSDGDGIDDETEVSLFREIYTVPFNGDLDGDGKTNINDDDIDGDSNSDVQEIARGSNPTNATSTPPALVLYDDFSSSSLDSTKWKTGEVIRETINGQLHLGLGSTPLNKNYVGLSAAPAAGALKTWVTMQPGAQRATNGMIATGIGGDYYNTVANATNFIGQVDASLYIGDTGSGYKAWFTLSEVTSADGSTWNVIVSQEISLSQALAVGSTYALEIVYNGNNGFTFKVHAVNTGTSSETLIGSSTYTGPDKRSTYASARALKSRVSGGRLIAAYDNVKTGGDGTSYTLYDDFSAAPLDQTKWNKLEYTIERTTSGQARLLSHSNGDTQRTVLGFKRRFQYTEAVITIDPNSWQNNGARGRGQLAGYLYNESHGPNSGQPYNGAEGDIFVHNQISKKSSEENFIGNTWHSRTLDAADTSWDQEYYRQFALPIATSQRYKLFIGWGGEFLVLGIQNLTTMAVEAEIKPIESAKYLPFTDFHALRSRVDGNGGQGVQISSFDDVYVSGDELAIDGDLNVDGNVDLSDAILGLKTLTGDNAMQTWSAGDVNGDGRIGLPEVMEVMNKVSGP